MTYTSNSQFPARLRCHWVGFRRHEICHSLIEGDFHLARLAETPNSLIHEQIRIGVMVWIWPDVIWKYVGLSVIVAWMIIGSKKMASVLIRSSKIDPSPIYTILLYFKWQDLVKYVVIVYSVYKFFNWLQRRNILSMGYISYQSCLKGKSLNYESEVF